MLHNVLIYVFCNYKTPGIEKLCNYGNPELLKY